MKTRAIKWTVGPETEPIFSEMQTTIEIVDEAAGEFVEVSQSGRESDGYGKISFNPDEWPAIRDAINKAVKLCK